jgi:hypothetical protein
VRNELRPIEKKKQRKEPSFQVFSAAYRPSSLYRPTPASRACRSAQLLRDVWRKMQMEWIGGLPFIISRKQ